MHLSRNTSQVATQNFISVKGLGLGLGMFYTINACRQRLEEKTHTMNARRGRLTEQAGSRHTERHAGRSYEIQALIPLVGNNSRFKLIYSWLSIHLYIHVTIYFTFRPAFSASNYSYLFIYNIIIPNGLYSNNPPLNPKGCL